MVQDWKASDRNHKILSGKLFGASKGFSAAAIQWWTARRTQKATVGGEIKNRGVL